jgi:integrase
MKNSRGLYEKQPGSGVWWIRYADDVGRIRREKVGSKGVAIALYRKRKNDVFEGKKLPGKLRVRMVRFSELAADALEYVKANNEGHQVDGYRIARLVEGLGDRPAEIPIEDLREWFDDQEWKAGTYNRYRTVLSLIYRLGMENKKVDSNPAKLLKHKREDDGRVRFLNQYAPYEEVRLREVVAAKFAGHMPELDVALNTGMRRSEQYLRTDWTCVDLLRRDLYIPQSKNGQSRHIPLNAEALAAFQELYQCSGGEGPIFASLRGGERLLGPRHWFDDAIREAGVKNFTWHDLRHTFASRLVMAGVDLRTVAELMGHKKIQMTMRYAHLAPAHKLAAVERLSSFNSYSSADESGGNNGRRPVILNPATEGATGTRTGTGLNDGLLVASEKVQ